MEQSSQSLPSGTNIVTKQVDLAAYDAARWCEAGRYLLPSDLVRIGKDFDLRCARKAVQDARRNRLKLLLGKLLFWRNG
jgi:hypothetical protein